MRFYNYQKHFSKPALLLQCASNQHPWLHTTECIKVVESRKQRLEQLYVLGYNGSLLEMPSQEEQFDCCQILWKAGHQDATAMKRRKTMQQGQVNIYGSVDKNYSWVIKQRSN